MVNIPIVCFSMFVLPASGLRGGPPEVAFHLSSSQAPAWGAEGGVSLFSKSRTARFGFVLSNLSLMRPFMRSLESIRFTRNTPAFTGAL
jgi:hypothetical protein